MPTYTRTGMVSHRHPFYGTSYESNYGLAVDWVDDEVGEAEKAAAEKAAAERASAEAAVLGAKDAYPTTPAPAASGGSAALIPLLVVGALGLFFLSGKSS